MVCFSRSSHRPRGISVNLQPGNKGFHVFMCIYNDFVTSKLSPQFLLDPIIMQSYLMISHKNPRRVLNSIEKYLNLYHTYLLFMTSANWCSLGLVTGAGNDMLLCSYKKKSYFFHSFVQVTMSY